MNSAQGLLGKFDFTKMPDQLHFLLIYFDILINTFYIGSKSKSVLT